MSTAVTAERLAWFATTHWSLVVSAGKGGDAESLQALETLCEKYWLPLYSFVRRRGYTAEQAQDLTQEFFLRLVQHNRVARADQQKGRFRSFLLSSLKNFLADEWDKANAQKRGGGVQTISMQFDTGEAQYSIEPVDNVTPEQLFERRWALTLLDSVLQRLRGEFDAEENTQLFTALSPCLVGEKTAQPYAELAAQLGMSETGIKSAVHRLRKRYRELLRCEIASTVASPSDIDDELRFLFEVLSRP